ncbi:hypothetical protein G6O69_15920 [Pseudenhygromyxa sp. WMMC2535]|uniref:hypothetical protein n=1 Tax=Pseudenhygromyxa sp. WMMC2535 TaxID=2712867 RepID=UPI0015573811|nr:hypothetical protein [Pseudenhygromyxa sp. WMMC2535]NVB39331.1 hypothetical protein [Pseudenhygromyxa sp. WMMC2535]
MIIKGTFYAGRRRYVCAHQGQPTWDRFEAELQERLPRFRGLITPTSRVDIDDYIAFQELTIELLYGGDQQAYWKLGYESGRWALTEGPYAHLLAGAQRGLTTLQELMVRLWSVYTDQGRYRATRSPEGFEIEVDQLDRWHACIELTIMGYGHGLIELITGAEATPQRIYGAAEGRLGCMYRFELDEANDAINAAGAAGSGPAARGQQARP